MFKTTATQNMKIQRMIEEVGPRPALIAEKLNLHKQAVKMVVMRVLEMDQANRREAA